MSLAKTAAALALSMTVLPMQASALPVLADQTFRAAETQPMLRVADSRKATETKINAQRANIRDHIEKHGRYTQQHEKDFAYKTIRNSQALIAKMRGKHPSIPASDEDTWKP